MSRSLKVRLECLEKVRFALKRNGFPNQKSLATDTGLALATISKFLTGKPVDYGNFIEICLRLALDWQAIADLGSEITQKPLSVKSHIKSADLHTDWGEAVDVSVFYGHTVELRTLHKWIVDDCCRLVALLGMGGIGKTALAVCSAISVQTDFDYVIWRSLRNAPPLEVLLADLVRFVSAQQETKGQVSCLIDYLRFSRCLLILDNWETILQGGDYVGRYRPGYEEYGELLRIIGETAHQSCLLITSREKPAEIAVLEGLELSVHSLSLRGSQEAAQALIHAKGLSGTQAQKQELGDRYNNSLLTLKIVATFIQDLFDGEIEEFFKQDTIVFNGIRRLLDQQFHRLSPLEMSIMYQLAINHTWTTITELHQDIVPAVSRANLLEALESLRWRSLIEKKSGSYTQQLVVMEYVTEVLIQQAGFKVLGMQRTIYPIIPQEGLCSTT